MNNMRKWVWLTTLNGMYSAKISILIDRFDCIDDIYSAGEADFKGIEGIRESDIKQLCNKSLDEADKIIERTRLASGYIMNFDSENYPERLKRLINPPYVLYVKGSFDFTRKTVNVGVVGTRECSDYGRVVTSKLCSDLAGEGFTVVSGMAEGIDSTAATTALRAGSETIAVLGCGIDVVYPVFNEDLMSHIVDHGAVISEYPPLSQPLRNHFPERNRIIAALSDCLLVTEAPIKSGSLITAKYAHEIGVKIYSVPGSVFLPNSVGTNILIKAGAEIVLCSRDIIEDYEVELSEVEKPKAGNNFIKEKLKNEVDLEKTEKEIPEKEAEEEEAPTVDEETLQTLSAEEKKIVELLIAGRKLSVDELIRQSGFSTQQVNSLLPVMEIGGIIKKHAGNFYTVEND